MIASAALALAACLPASEGLEALPDLRDFASHRITSVDPTGRNADWRDLEPGKTLVLADIRGPGMIVHIRDNITSREPHHLQLHVLRMYWNGEAAPSVEAPIGDFFGVGFGFTEKYSSALVAIDQRPGKLTDPAAMGAARNCYIPMPFARSARIEIANEGREPSRHWYEVNYRAYREPPRDVGSFHAQYRQGTPPPAGPFVLLEAKGRGHLLGCVLSIKNVDGGWWGEGDEIVEVDGKETIHGTGSEDYFCESYGLRPGCFPYFGVTLLEEPFITAYRWHVPDPVTFRESIRFLIEQGDGNPPFKSGNHYYGVTYWYQTEPHALFPPLPDGKARTAWLLKGFIRDWWAIGPFDNEGKRGFDAVYPPETEIDLGKAYPGKGGEARWKRASSEVDGALVLDPLFAPNDDVAGYALAYVHAPRRTEALLLTGSDDTITAWLGGKRILGKNEYRLAAPDQDATEIVLEEGWNQLLFKVCEGPSFWKLYARIVGRDREPIEGIRYAAEKK